MSFKHLVTFSLAFILFSCSPKKIDPNGFSIKNNIIYKKWFQNAILPDKLNRKPKGRISIIMLKMGWKNGEFKITFESGNVIMKGNIVNDKNEGKWVYYYPSGELESEGNFHNDKPDSIWVWYFPSGKVKEKGNFINGLREGNWKRYDELGNVSMENEYKNGVAIVLNHK